MFMYDYISLRITNFINKYYRKNYILKINDKSLFIVQLYVIYNIFNNYNSKLYYIIYVNIFNICNKLHNKISNKSNNKIIKQYKLYNNQYFIINNLLFLYLLLFKMIIYDNTYLISLINMFTLLLILIKNAYKERLYHINNNISSHTLPSIYKIIILSSNKETIVNIVNYLRYFTFDNFFILLNILHIFM